MTALAGRSTVAARVPSIEGIVIEAKFLNEMGDAAAMLMAAVQKNNRSFGITGAGRPRAIEEFCSIMANKFILDQIALVQRLLLCIIKPVIK